MARQAPLISFRGYQEEVFWQDFRTFFLLWRRQAGKSFTLSAKALSRMIKRKGHLCVFCSASIALGTEFIRKEAEVWRSVTEKYRAIAKDAGLKLETNADGLDLDAICDLFEHDKLETKIWHDQTTCSRSRVVAPNPATAVGWTGDVFLDEVGRVPNLKDVLEALGPIMDANPEFLMWMATTPPPDDKHYSFELFQPPVREWAANARGNYYETTGSIPCHRFDAIDAGAAGLKFYHPKTRAVISWQEHRALAFDKTAWDRNYLLKFVAGGAAAVSMAALARAMARGQELGLVGVNVTEEVVA
jgi:hypothetical protein